MCIRTIALWAGFLLIGVGAQASAPTRLDPLLDIVARDPRGAAPITKSLGRGKSAQGAVLLSVLVKTTDEAAVRRAIAAVGGVVRTDTGSILSAAVPATALRTLAATPGVVYIEADKPLAPRLNQSVPAVNGDDVNTTSGAATAGLPQAYTGSGVIVGVVDSGIDCLHSDFRDGSGNTRMLAYWDQTSGTTGVSEITGSSGTEYTGNNLESACSAAADGDADGHGSHVAGIAASSHSTYRGMAPGASIVAVKNAPSDARSGGNFATTVLDAVNYIFRKAAAQTPQMPAVVNLSLGTSIGAHDGTSLFEQGLDELLENGSADKQGRAIVNAAGNENFMSSSTGADTFGGIHASIEQTSAQRAYDFLIRNASILSSSSFGFVQVELWLDAGSACTVQVDAFNSTSSKAESARVIDMNAVSPGDSAVASDDNVRITLNFTDDNNANNGKQHAVVTITRPSTFTASAASYSFDLIVLGTCTGDAWLYPDFTALVDFRKADALSVATSARGYTYVSGDSLRTITIPATANKVIAVGSYMHAQNWTDVNVNAHSQSDVTGSVLNDISLFSSLGPTADARVKPDLVAPGEPIVSTIASTISSDISSSNKGDSTHHKLEGTSMAAPHVAGAVALLLQRNGCLTPTQIRTALRSTTQAPDSFTGDTLPDNTWGYGKLDVLAATEAVTAASCAPSNSNETGAGTAAVPDTTTTTDDADDDSDDEIVNGGGGSCSLLEGLASPPPQAKPVEPPPH